MRQEETSTRTAGGRESAPGADVCSSPSRRGSSRGEQLDGAAPRPSVCRPAPCARVPRAARCPRALGRLDLLRAARGWPSPRRRAARGGGRPRRGGTGARRQLPARWPHAAAPPPPTPPLRAPARRSRRCSARLHVPLRRRG